MCGRFAISQPHFTRIERALNTSFGEVKPSYNIAPSERIPVIRQTDEGYTLFEMKWGLVPSWSKTPTTPFSTFNARIETVAEKPMFRSALRHRRCLIPASGFYEWHTENKHKQPYYFSMADGEEMALAGLWEEWKSSDGEILQSCTIVVGQSNPLVGKIHDRMATIVPEASYANWLDPMGNTEELLAKLTVPYPADLMQSWKVDMRVNSVRNQGPDLIKPQS